MKSIAVSSLIVAAAADKETFSTWSAKHTKKYATKEELVMRRAIFAANAAKYAKHNAENSDYTLGTNQFSDLTATEFKAMYTGGFRNDLRKPKVTEEFVAPVKANPASVDWVAAGAVTPIKNQGQCGSCWAFSTTGSTEGATFIAKKTLISLSEQQLVDCSSAEGNQGCNGGLMDQGFQYIINNKGINTEAAYPYTAQDGTCNAKLAAVAAATLSSYKDVTVGNELALETAIVQQPVSVAIEADQEIFQGYTSGVITGKCGTALDHGVLAVGYGTLSGKEYYKVKNSWGTSWGMNGYVLLGRGSGYNGNNGQCGIQMSASYPIV